MTTKEALYQRLIDQTSPDDVDLARRLLALLRQRGSLGVLNSESVRDLTPLQLVALRNALVHGSWAIESTVEESAQENGAPPENLLERRLGDANLLATQESSPDNETRRDRRPVRARGKPLSEQILEERR
jgi:hypothetical protein